MLGSYIVNKCDIKMSIGFVKKCEVTGVYVKHVCEHRDITRVSTLRPRANRTATAVTFVKIAD